MSIKIQLPPPMWQHVGGKDTVEATGITVQTAMDDLAIRFPALSQRIFENGQIRRHINLYVNNEDVRYLNGLATALTDGDELSIMPMVSGG